MGERTHRLLHPNVGLHEAAIRGDDGALRRALALGADINALDNTGRTVLACAVAGNDWATIDASFMTSSRLNALQILLGHRDISLYTLNASQKALKGVTPLGMASWLNIPEAVKTLLQWSVDAVSVDGMDCHGATALMYAARDGSLEVVQQLLSHGARPDFRDVNHRTPIQYSLAHPQVLWLFEAVLRRHRWRETLSAGKKNVLNLTRPADLAGASLPSTGDHIPPPTSIFKKTAMSRMTETLIQAVQSSQITFLRSLLFFSPTFAIRSIRALPTVNSYPSSPSIPVFDALYASGADVSLFTTHEQYTPLHCLARAAHPSRSTTMLHDFIIHLVLDARAPLSARDKDEETCIHLAAEHGSSIDILLTLLECDITHSVRNMRNSRGLSALQVAQPEFRAAFGAEAENLRSVSSMSTKTIRPMTCSSTTSLSPIPVEAPPLPHHEIDTDALCHEILTNLRLTDPLLLDHADASLLEVDKILCKTSQLGRTLFGILRARADDSSRELRYAENMHAGVDALLDTVETSVVAKLESRGLEPIRSPRRNRDSEDSQATVVSVEGNFEPSEFKFLLASGLIPGESLTVRGRHASTPTTPSPVSSGSKRDGLAGMWAEGHKSFIFGVDSRAHKIYLETTPQIKGDILEQQDKTRCYQDADKQASMISIGLTEAKKSPSKRGAAKFKAWLKKMVAEASPKEDVAFSGPVQGSAIDVNVLEVLEVKPEESLIEEPSSFCDILVDNVLCTAHVVLSAASRDLASITECISAADKLDAFSCQSISRAERIFQRALKKREATITHLRTCRREFSLDRDLSVPWPILPDSSGSPSSSASSTPSSSRPSTANSALSVFSSCVSLTSTLAEADDEDIRALSRLILRKLPAKLDGVREESRRIHEWTRIVKETLRGVKRRAYL